MIYKQTIFICWNFFFKRLQKIEKREQSSSVELKILAEILNLVLSHERSAWLVSRCALAHISKVFAVLAYSFIKSLTIRTLWTLKPLPVRFFSSFLFSSWNVFYYIRLDHSLWQIFLVSDQFCSWLFLSWFEFIDLFLHLKHIALAWVVPLSNIEKIWRFLVCILFQIIHWFFLF